MSLLVLAFFLGVATWLQLSLGLRPLGRLRQEIAEIASGRRRRLAEEAPDEVLPLVRALNELIETQECEMEREGNAEVASSLDTIGETMRRHVERASEMAVERGVKDGNFPAWR